MQRPSDLDQGQCLTQKTLRDCDSRFRFNGDAFGVGSALIAGNRSFKKDALNDWLQLAL